MIGDKEKHTLTYTVANYEVVAAFQINESNNISLIGATRTRAVVLWTVTPCSLLGNY
jgi:hypothetical protein